MSAIIKSVVKELFTENIDGITFFPKNAYELDLRGFEYNKKSKYVTHTLGNIYHIMIYKINENGYLIDKDNFEAILTDPHVYASNLIISGFYGVIVKKTKKSCKLINELFENFTNERVARSST